MRLRDGAEGWDEFVLSGEMALECVLGVCCRMWVWKGGGEFVLYDAYYSWGAAYDGFLTFKVYRRFCI